MAATVTAPGHGKPVVRADGRTVTVSVTACPWPDLEAELSCSPTAEEKSSVRFSRQLNLVCLVPYHPSIPPVHPTPSMVHASISGHCLYTRYSPPSKPSRYPRLCYLSMEVSPPTTVGPR